MSKLLMLLVPLSIMHAACRATPSPVTTPPYPSVPSAARPSTLGAVQASALAPPTSTPLEAPVDYAPRGRRDPFAPLSAGRRAEPRRSILASARLTGIVRGARGSLALVETPDGTGIILRAGERLGEGRLLDIGEDFALFDLEVPASTPTHVVLRLEPTS
jgi:Tfp pilus assembly protein PilP